MSKGGGKHFLHEQDVGLGREVDTVPLARCMSARIHADDNCPPKHKPRTLGCHGHKQFVSLCIFLSNDF